MAGSSEKSWLSSRIPVVLLLLAAYPAISISGCGDVAPPEDSPSPPVNSITVDRSGPVPKFSIKMDHQGGLIEMRDGEEVVAVGRSLTDLQEQLDPGGKILLGGFQTLLDDPERRADFLANISEAVGDEVTMEEIREVLDKWVAK